jgi:hypothetical protein
MSRRSVALIVLCAACGGASAANIKPAAVPAASSGNLRPVPAPSRADRANVERLERSLADDSMEGRGTATPGGEKAARYLAAEMKKIGLAPGGDDGYFQRVPMFMTVPVTAVASSNPAGGNAGVAGRAGRGAGGGRGAGTVPNPETLKCEPRDPQGRTAAEIIAARVAQRAADSAAGRLPVASGGGAGRGAGRGAGGGGRGAAGPPRGSLRVLPSIADLDTVPADRRRKAENVIGILPGGDPVLKSEVVLVLSHYDHLGIRTPATLGGDSIYNGADDDAAGTVAVLEVARLLKKAGTPRRTIVFANMTGEEIGMLGTNYFISHPVFPLSQMVAGLEIEMIGRPDSLAGGPGKAWLTGYERSTMGDMLKQYGIAILPDMRPDQGFFSRSDNVVFARRGIVAHTLSTFNLHKDYHQVSDDVSKVDFDHMTGVVHSAAEAVRHLADGPKPEWHPGCSPQAPVPARQ